MNKKIISSIISILIFYILYLISKYNYLLFHNIVEMLNVIIAGTIFFVAWNSKEYLNNNYFIVIGTSYLYVGIMDFLHAMSYKGMNIITQYDDFATQIWIGSRYILSISMVIAILCINRVKKLNFHILVYIYAIITAVLLLSIYKWRIFPICYVDVNGKGQTIFKIISEYIIIAIMILSLILMNRNKNKFNEKVYKYISLSILISIISEFCFTLYTDFYGISNFIAHCIKIFAFYFIYKVMIEEGIRSPYNVIFHEMKQYELKLQEKNRELELKSNVDGLTNLYNHRFLYEWLNEELERSNRHQRKLSIILFDIDYFKQINDNYGHIKGDEVLEKMGKIINEYVRISDIAGRFGGEEFLLILPETGIEAAYLLAERIRKSVEKSHFGLETKVTISGGVAEYKIQTADEFINSADENLYKAKENGRNRIEMGI